MNKEIALIEWSIRKKIAMKIVLNIGGNVAERFLFWIIFHDLESLSQKQTFKTYPFKITFRYLHKFKSALFYLEYRVTSAVEVCGAPQ